MAPMTSDQKIAFLLCALRHSGKTNWAGVGDELGLKTGTASKRLEYITKASTNAGVSGGDGGKGTPVKTPKKSAGTPKGKSGRNGNSPAKKVKLENGRGADVDEDHEEELEPEETPKYDRKRRIASEKIQNYKESSDEEEVEEGQKGEKGEETDEDEHGEVKDVKIEQFADANEYFEI